MTKSVKKRSESKFGIGARLALEWSPEIKSMMVKRLEKQKGELFDKCEQLGIKPTENAVLALVDNVHKETESNDADMCRFYLGLALHYHSLAYDLCENDRNIEMAYSCYEDVTKYSGKFEREVAWLRVKPLVEHSNKFKPKRKKGSLSKNAKHIHQLVKDNPALTAKELRAKADVKLIDNMADSTFSTHCTNARKLYPKTKKQS